MLKGGSLTPASLVLSHILVDEYLTSFFVCFFVLFCLFAFSSAAPMAYGGSQARDLIETVATGLRHSHSNAGSSIY